MGTMLARYWHKRDDGQIECDLCPRACVLEEGQAGACANRAHRGGVMIATSYGRASGFCIDPIEKKPLYHFLPGSAVLSFGTTGCNLVCRFCQNWDISRARGGERLSEAASPEAIAESAARLGCRSVAFTYNDPVVFLEYAADVADACHRLGIATVAVSAGYVTEAARPDLFDRIDAANIDLKSFSDTFYRRLCGARLDPVKETLRWLVRESKVWVEITTLLIPGENDSPAEIAALSGWIAAELGPEVPLHFTAFHPDWKMTDRLPTDPATLARARAIARAEGLRHVYTGNVRDREGGSTWCPSCGARLIGRDGYLLTEWGLSPEGACLGCGAPLAGRFEAEPGTWGARRQPVQLGA